ncbi:MAG: DUF5700 domain-containing putative Zn-dependent protease [Bacillota bacterium]
MCNCDIRFDFSFAEDALSALQTRTLDSALPRLARLGAVDHLRRHTDRFSADEVPEGLVLAAGLLRPLAEQPDLLPGIRRTVGAAHECTRRSEQWKRELLRLLPEGHRFRRATLHFTLGYDLGVVSNGQSASVNLAHPHLLQNPRHVKYFIIHELHHVGFLMYRDLQPIRDIRSRDELRHLVEGLTQLEGLGTYAPWRLREKDGALTAHRDYVALLDPELMENLEVQFWRLYRSLDHLPDEMNSDAVMHQLASFGDPQKLFHLVGCRFARRIHRLFGLRKLRTTILDGPAAFLRLARMGASP